MTTLELFISHSSSDVAVAEAIVGELEKRGITCWFAPRDVPLGAAYQEEIVQALDDSQAVLLIFSKAANASSHILREIELAVQAAKPIYPVRIDGTVPARGLRYLLANTQWVDHKAPMSGLADKIERLMRSPTRRAVGGGGVPVLPDQTGEMRSSPPAVPDKGRRGRAGLIAAGSIGAICIVAATSWIGYYGSGSLWRSPERPRASIETEGAPSPRQESGPTPAAPAPAAIPPATPVPTSGPPRTIERRHAFSPPTGAETRRAFLVGVQRYSDSYFPQLTRTLVDAEDLANDLEDLGFEKRNVTLLRDVRNRASFTDAFDGFLRTVEPGNTVVFSFSGHGFGRDASQGQFVLTADAKSPFSFTRDQLAGEGRNPDIVRLRVPAFMGEYAKAEMPRAGIALQEMIAKISARQPKAVLMFLDACRTLTPASVRNPPSDAIKCSLADLKVPDEFIVLRSAWSEEDPVESFDLADRRRNSLFFEVLRGEIMRPGQTAPELAKRVSAKVLAIAEHNGRQQHPTYIFGNQTHDVRLIEPVGGDRLGLPADQCAGGSIAWRQVRRLKDRAAYLRFMRKFDGCAESEMARQELVLLAIDGEDLSPVAPRRPLNDINECDQLAASPYAPKQTMFMGVAFSAIDPERAIAACVRALRDSPNESRFLFNLGRAYLRDARDRGHSEGDRSSRQARIAFTDAAARGYTLADNHIAVMLELDRRPHEEVNKFLSSGIDKGDPAAMLNMSRRYYEGTAGVRDLTKWRTLLVRSAETGFLPAMVEIGETLRTGAGSDSNNPQRALEWYLRAADGGSQIAKMQLGMMFITGISWRGFVEADRKPDVARDPAMALLWFGRAAQAGDTEAAAQLARAVEISGKSLNLPSTLADHYQSLAASGGNTAAQVARARKSLRPTSLAPADREQVIHDLKQLVEASSAPAAFLLAQVYRRGLLQESANISSALSLAYLAIELAARGDPTEPGAEATDEMLAAHLIVEMARNRELLDPKGSPLLAPDEVERFEYFYGAADPASHQVKVERVNSVLCGQALDLSIWNWDRKGAPTDVQLQAINNDRVTVCPDTEQLRQQLSNAYDQARGGAERFSYRAELPPGESRDVGQQYLAELRRLSEDTRTGANQNDDPTGIVIEEALGKAYRTAGLEIFETFAAEPWTHDMLRLMIVRAARSELSSLRQGTIRGLITSDDLSQLLGRAAKSVYFRVFELSELIAVLRSGAALGERLRQSSLGGVTAIDVATSAAMVNSAQPSVELAELLRKEGNEAISRTRAQRIILDCLNTTIGDVAMSSLSPAKLAPWMEASIAGKCSQWVTQQFVGKDKKFKPQTPVPARATWSASGLTDDASMYGRPTR